jgi:iron complex transport system ATP-binding protein
MTGMKQSESPILKLEDLHIGYSQSYPRKDSSVYGPLDVDIQGPEMIGIIGRNGIGKSTLLRTLAGIQPALKGKIFIFGSETKRISRSAIAQLVSYVSTEAIHIPNLSVTDLVTMGRFPYTNWIGKLTYDDTRIIKDAIEHTGIQQLRYKPVHRLSDGEKQKVMIARALAQDTPIIFLDEPTAFLDLPARHEILRLLHNLTREKNKLIVFSTHDLAIAMDEVDKLWLMTREGLIEGAPEDLLINQGFRKLFENSEMEYDSKSLAFRFSRDLKRNITIYGELPYATFTSKAMERIGFRTTQDKTTEYAVTIESDNNSLQWKVTGKDGIYTFSSIYALTSFFMKDR